MKEYKLKYFCGVWNTHRKFTCITDSEAIYDAENPTEWEQITAPAGVRIQSAPDLAESLKNAGWGVALFCGNRRVKEYAPTTFYK